MVGLRLPGVGAGLGLMPQSLLDICVSVQRTLFPCRHSTFWFLRPSRLFFHVDPCILRWVGLEIDVPTSHSGLLLSAHWLVEGLCVNSICCRRKKVLWWELTGRLTQGYNNTPLRVGLIRQFSRTIAVSSPLGATACLSPGSWPVSGARYGFQLLEQA